MDETERIRKMVAAGTITDEEAERLLSVLRDIDSAEAELAASGEAMEVEARAAAGETAAAGEPGAGVPAADPPPAAAPPAAAAAAAESAASKAAASEAASVGAATAPTGASAAAEGTRWLHLSLLAGDIDVRSDPDVSEVTLSGDAESLRLEPAGDGATLRYQGAGGSDSWVDRFVNRLRSTHVRVRLPTDYGVDLNVTAGDVKLSGVPYLRGRLTSGDLKARGLKGVDLVTSAGDIDLEMTLTEGHNSLRATAGDVDIRLGGGSNVALSGSVSIGNASVRGHGFEVSRHGVGQRFEGRLGDGAASLDVHVTTGNLHVKVDDDS